MIRTATTSSEAPSVIGAAASPSAAARPRAGALSPFDRIALGSLVLTAGVALLAYRAGSDARGSLSPGLLVVIPAFLIGYIHNAVGYRFLAASPVVRTALRLHPWRYAGGALLAIALSAPFYVLPVLSLAAYTLFLLHAGENVAYQIERLEDPLRRQASPGLFPFAAVLILTAALPRYLLDSSQPLRLAQVGVLLAGLSFIRLIMPAPIWSAGWDLARRNPLTTGIFLVVPFFVGDGDTYFYLFVLWHYLTWIAYTWVMQPSARRRLVVWHCAVGAPYVVLFAIALAKVAILPPLLVWLLISPVAFMAQSMTHVLLTAALRVYPAAAR